MTDNHLTNQILQKLDAEVEGLHRRNRSSSGYIDPERGERMKELMTDLRAAFQANEEKMGMLKYALESLLVCSNNTTYPEAHPIWSALSLCNRALKSCSYIR